MMMLLRKQFKKESCSDWQSLDPNRWLWRHERLKRRMSRSGIDGWHIWVKRMSRKWKISQKESRSRREQVWEFVGAACSIGKRADPNSVRPDTRPIGRYTGRVSGWEYCHPVRIGLSSVELTCTPSAARANGFSGRSDRSLLVANPVKRRSNL